METLWLLAKINVVFQITEKVVYAGIALFASKVAYNYYRDYKYGVDQEKYSTEKKG